MNENTSDIHAILFFAIERMTATLKYEGYVNPIDKIFYAASKEMLKHMWE